ncbi:hypothetical protein [Salipiger sp. PrR007]|uniref:hypothetical protein n=1 Tax=Salipiger sp. PrR007 TaxID=2706884 RepID=UPI0013BCB79F|nr:hypothetical protein [Salipiger sp. PrR007]NDW33027.1 hypothetical protein [Salipiger sp. PrR007]
MSENDRDLAGGEAPLRYLAVVLGMHRSGTSALGGILAHLGCEMPKSPMPANENNPKGYFESLKVYQLNDEILRVVRSSWRDWREISPAWVASAQGQAYLLRARDVLLSEFEGATLGVLKDPRICRLVPFWAEAARMAGFQLLPILTHRNPLEVAKSMQTRDGIDASEGMLVWLRHVLDAEAGTRGMRRCTTSYTAVLQNWVKQVIALQSALGVSWPRFDDRSSMEIEAFLSGKLRHFEEVPEKIIENPTLSVWVRDTYAILERWVQQPEKTADHKRLDRIRAEFNAAAPAFGQLVGPPEQDRFSLQAKLQEVQQQGRVELAQAQQQIAPLQAERDGALEKVKAAETGWAETRAERDDALEKLKAAETGWTETRVELEDTVSGLRAELSQAQSALAQRRLESEQEAARAKAAEEERDAALEGFGELEKEMAALRERHAARLADVTGQWRRETAELTVALDELRNLSSDNQAHFRDLKQKLAALSSEKAQLEASNRAKEARLRGLTADYETYAQKAKKAAEEVRALRSSTSWRITAPVRRVLNALRGQR